MSAALGRLAGACARRARVVVLMWVLAAAGLTAAAQVAGPTTTDGIEVTGSDSAAAAALLGGTEGEGGEAGERMVLRVPEGTLADPAAAAALDATLAGLRTVDGVAAVPDPRAGEGGALSADGTAVRLDVALGEGVVADRELGESLLAAAGPAREAGLDAALGGPAGRRLSGDARTSELVGLAAGLVVLLAWLRSAAAALVPLAGAVVGVATGLGVVDLLGLVVDVPTVAPTLATMIGLGVGVDYGLFQVVRTRRLLGAGTPTVEAVAGAGASAGHAVVFAGGTVAVALLGLAPAGVGFLTVLGWTCALVVLVAVGAAVTLVPALAALAGGRLVPPSSPAAGPGRVDRAARAVVARPWTALLAGLALLLALGAPVLALDLGQTDGTDHPPDTQTRRYTDVVAAGFGPGANGPLTVVAAHTPADPRTGALREGLLATPGVASVSPPRPVGEGAVALTVVPTTAPGDPATAELIGRLRAGAAADAHVGGATAVRVDLAERLAERLPLVVAVVVGLGALLLLVQFRSLVVPLKAAAMNLVSIGAGFGAIVVVVQEGVGSGLIGLDGPVPVDAYVPLMLFVVLFGLSMDYEVFLLTAIREHWTPGADPRDAVARGLTATAGVVTAAAVVMIAVFASFTLHDDPVVKTFGLGMAVAVLVDATVVRGLLVPAAMVLMGRWNWWLPRPLVHLTGRTAPVERIPS